MSFFGPKFWVEVYGFPFNRSIQVMRSVKRIISRKYKVTGEKNLGDYLIIYLHRDALRSLKNPEEAFKLIFQIEDYLEMTFGRATNAFVTIEMGQS